MADDPQLAPFTRETAVKKVQAAEDAWNTRDPERVAFAYTEDSVGRTATRASRDASRSSSSSRRGRPHRGALPVRVRRRGGPVIPQLRQRAVGVRRAWPHAPPRGAGINDVPIEESERRIFWPRPESEHGLDVPLR